MCKRTPKCESPTFLPFPNRATDVSERSGPLGASRQQAVKLQQQQCVQWQAKTKLRMVQLKEEARKRVTPQQTVLAKQKQAPERLVSFIQVFGLCSFFWLFFSGHCISFLSVLLCPSARSMCIISILFEHTTLIRFHRS